MWTARRVNRKQQRTVASLLSQPYKISTYMILHSLVSAKPTLPKLKILPSVVQLRIEVTRFATPGPQSARLRLTLTRANPELHLFWVFGLGPLGPLGLPV